MAKGGLFKIAALGIATILGQPMAAVPAVVKGQVQTLVNHMIDLAVLAEDYDRKRGSLVFVSFGLSLCR